MQLSTCIDPAQRDRKREAGNCWQEKCYLCVCVCVVLSLMGRTKSEQFIAVHHYVLLLAWHLNWWRMSGIYQPSARHLNSGFFSRAELITARGVNWMHINFLSLGFHSTVSDISLSPRRQSLCPAPSCLRDPQSYDDHWETEKTDSAPPVSVCECVADRWADGKWGTMGKLVIDMLK